MNRSRSLARRSRTSLARRRNPISNTVAAVLTTAAGVGFGLFFYELFTKARAA